MSEKHFAHTPTAPFTLHRQQFQQAADLRWINHFASWITKVTKIEITEENFEDDLIDGIALCRIVSKLKGSEVISYHEDETTVIDQLKGKANEIISKVTGTVYFEEKDNPSSPFKNKENLVIFQTACKKLGLPISFGSEDLEKRNITRIVSTLLFLAHVAFSQKILTKEMDDELLRKCEEMHAAMVGDEEGPVPTWSQQLMTKIGLSNWFQ